jgi:hypothetical protein
MDFHKQPSRAFIAAICLVALSSFIFARSDDAQKRLTENRRKWSSKAVKNYQYDFQRICFCVPAYTKPVKITAREGVAAQIEHADTGEAVDKAKFELYYTVAELFDYIQAAIDKKAHSIKVVYDDELGYPTSVEIDYIENAMDDEMRFKTGKLVVEKQ